MKTIRISPSLLESYRLTQIGAFGKTGDSLEADIVGARTTSEAMSRGTAYHKMIEDGAAKYAVGTTYEVHESELNKTWRFHPDAVAPLIAVRDRFPSMLHEIKATWKTYVHGFEVLMTMRLDGLHGTVVHEFKTKSSSPSFTEYFDSMQWRAYLMAFPELTSVQYHIFQLNEKNDRCQYHTFTMRRHAEIQQELQTMLHSFISWMTTRPHLIDFLENKALKEY